LRVRHLERLVRGDGRALGISRCRHGESESGGGSQRKSEGEMAKMPTAF
jgi:hypothetical protein